MRQLGAHAHWGWAAFILFPKFEPRVFRTTDTALWAVQLEALSVPWGGICLVNLGDAKLGLLKYNFPAVRADSEPLFPLIFRCHCFYL